MTRSLSTIPAFVSVALALAGVLARPAGAFQGPLPSEEPQRFQPLPEYVALRQKLISGEPVHVGVIGGSVTHGGVAQPNNGYVRTEDGWVFVFLDGLARLYPNVQWSNGAVAASDSIYGYQRVRDDVRPDEWDHWPVAVDLMVWEYVINDSDAAYNSHGSSGEPATDPHADLSLPRRIARLEYLSRTYQEAGGAGAIYMMAGARRGYSIHNRPSDPTNPGHLLSEHFNYDRARAITRAMSSRLGIPLFDTPVHIAEDPAFQGLQMFRPESVPGNVNHPTPEGHRAMGEGALRHLLRVLDLGGDHFPLETELGIPPVSPSPSVVRSYWVGETGLRTPAAGWAGRSRSPQSPESYRWGGRYVMQCVEQDAPEDYPFELAGLDLANVEQLTFVVERWNPAGQGTNAVVEVSFNRGQDVRVYWSSPTGSPGTQMRHANLMDDLPSPLTSVELRVLGPADPSQPMRFAFHGIMLNLSAP